MADILTNPIGLRYTCLVDADEAYTLQDMMEKHCITSAAQKLLLRNIFQYGVSARYADGVGGKALSNDYLDFIKEIVHPFFLRTFRPLLALGYVAFDVVRDVDPKTGRPLLRPVVIPRKCYKLSYRMYNDLRSEWVAEDVHFLTPGVEGIQSRQFKVFFLPGQEPNTDTGKHCSMMSPLIDHIEFTNGAMKLVMRAQTQMSAPPVAIEESPDTSTNISNISNVKPADAVLDAEDNNEFKQKMFMWNAAYYEGFTQQKREAEAAEDEGQATASHNSKKVKFTPTTTSNIYMVPPGWKMASAQPPMPKTELDVMALEGNLREDVCANFGVPLGMILAATKGAGMGANSVDNHEYQMFARLIKWWCEVYKEFGRQIYLLMNPGLEAPDVVLTPLFTPFVTNNAIHTLRLQNVMDGDRAKEELMRVNGFDVMDIAKKPNVIDAPPLGGSENGMTMLTDSKKEVQAAEKEKLLADAEKLRAEAKAILHPPAEQVSEKELKIKEMEFEMKKFDLEAQKQLIQLKIQQEEHKTKQIKQRGKVQKEVNKSQKVAPKG